MGPSPGRSWVGMPGRSRREREGKTAEGGPVDGPGSVSVDASTKGVILALEPRAMTVLRRPRMLTNRAIIPAQHVGIRLDVSNKMLPKA